MVKSGGAEVGVDRRASTELVNQPPDSPLNLTARVAQPYNAARLLAYLRVRAIGGVECVEAKRYKRIICISGEPRRLTIDFSRVDADGVITASCVPAGGLDSQVVRRIVMALTDADAPIAAIERHLGKDQVLAPLVRRNSGTRVPGSVDPFELTVRAIMGQQVSIAAARTLARRLATRWGSPFAIEDPELTVAFPEPGRLVEAPLEEVGLSRGRAGAIRALSSAVVEGRILLRGAGEARLTVESLLSIRGIGPWTAAYAALRGFGNRDAIPVADLGLRQALAGSGAVWSASEVARRAEGWRPWRGYGAIHLWNTFLPA